LRFAQLKFSNPINTIILVTADDGLLAMRGRQKANRRMPLFHQPSFVFKKGVIISQHHLHAKKANYRM